MVATFQEHKTHLAKQDPRIFLGYLVWYTLHEMGGATEMCVSHADAVALLQSVGITDILPAYPRDFDVFRRVSRDAEERRVPTGMVGVVSNYHLTEVSGRGDRVIVRRIVKETIDSDGQSLEYQQLMDVKFDRDEGTIETSECEDILQDPRAAKRIVDDLRTRFSAHKGMLTSYVVREYIRKLLIGKGATCVRSGGGVYFLQEALSDHVAAVETFTNALPQNVGEFHSLPLIDDGKQRDMVRRAFEAESAGACDELTIEIREIKKSGKEITQDRYARMFRNYHDLHKKTKEYSSLLDKELSMTDSRLEVLERSIVSLGKLVKDGTSGSN